MEVAAATEELSVEEVSEVAAKQEESAEIEAVAEVETSPETEAAPEEEAAATEEAAEEVTARIVFLKLNWAWSYYLALGYIYHQSSWRKMAN